MAVAPVPILASDAERQAVVARLHAATVEGRLTLDEFGERVSGVYGARTRVELAVLVQDLPPVAVPAPTFPPPIPPSPPYVPASPSKLFPVLALVFGIASLPPFAFMGAGALSGVAGIVLGIIGLRRIRRGTASGRGMAVGGIVSGALGVVSASLLMVFLGIF